MHWTYELPSANHLQQGDILRRTKELDSVIESVHPHYFRKSTNTHFIVLTQSCDLVRREEKNQRCDARYITLAVVRSLPYVLELQIQANEFFHTDDGIGLCTQRNRERIRMFLERLLNNNEPDYFFLRAEPSCGFAEDSCSILRLSVPIRSDLHYKSCLDSRLLSLSDVFKAKLGWLVGQMYSRVGTVDWREDERDKVVESTLDTNTIWVDERHRKALKKLVDDHRRDRPSEPIDRTVLSDWTSRLPKRKEEVIRIVQRVLDGRNSMAAAEIEHVVSQLRNDPDLATILRN